MEIFYSLNKPAFGLALNRPIYLPHGTCNSFANLHFMWRYPTCSFKNNIHTFH